jgi:phosphoribosylamine---glycine ligase
VNVLILGSGGREHALCAALRASATVGELYCVPGNGGTAALCAPASLDPGDTEALRRFVREQRIELVVPGSESFIAAGVADALAGETAVFAPTREAGRLESSKVFGTELRQRHGIPAPRTAIPATLDEALAAADELVADSGGVAVKADGLAAGKGVVVVRDREAAHEAIRGMLVEGRFGKAGSRVVLEELVEGEEVSVMALVDGKRAVPLLAAQDYKRLSDGNSGPNTGGMGAYAPVPWFGPELLERAEREVLGPTVAALRAEGIDYRGVLYAGLIVGKSGLLVLEYNARFGDPETEAVLPLLESDLAELMLATARGGLAAAAPRWRSGASVCVVLAAAGYPGAPRSGDPIEGIAEAEASGAQVFHAGTRRDAGRLVTAGGRVLAVTALGASLAEAAARAHEAAELIRFDGAQRRADIGRIGNGPGAGPIAGA